MALTILRYIFFAGGVAAIVYSLLALLSWMKHVRFQKFLPDKFEPEASMSAADGPPVAEALWQRAKILLQNERFDAAFADCKRVLEINPDHADARSIWEHLVPPEPVPKIPAGKALPLVAEVEEGDHKHGKASSEAESKKAEHAAGRMEPVEAEAAVTPQDRVRSKLLLLLRLKYLKK